jgi:PadR family transcriptional regulator PadR
MDESGLLRSEWSLNESGRRTHIYQLTAVGTKQLADEEARWRIVTTAINRLLRTV